MAENKLEEHIRSIPVIIRTKYVSFQVSFDVFRVKNHEMSDNILKRLNEEKYGGHDDWFMPGFGECYLIKEAGFNWYASDKSQEFLVRDSQERAFCVDGVPGWIAHCPAGKVHKVFFIRIVKEN